MNVNMTPFDSIRAPHLGDVGDVVSQADESALALLAAENASLRGRLAGGTPSPMASNGGSEPILTYGKVSSMREAFLAAAAEHGYRPRG
jgi:hypothetical protein